MKFLNKVKKLNMENIDKKDFFKILKDIYKKSFYKDLISLKDSKYLNIIEHKNKS